MSERDLLQTIKMSYRLDFGPENIQELDANIDAEHEKFLASDNPDKRADSLRYLAGNKTIINYKVTRLEKDY